MQSIGIGLVHGLAIQDVLNSISLILSANS